MPDRLATQLLLMARDPATGRIPRRGRVDIALRGALFADLLLQGRVVSDSGAPAIMGAEETGDRVLDAVARTVRRRPGVAWWRWFRHVRGDRQVLVAELVESGRWTQTAAGLMPRWQDSDPNPPQAQRFELTRVVGHDRAMTSASEGALAALASISGVLDGRARARVNRPETKALFAAIRGTGEVGADDLPRMIAGAAVLSRRPLRR